MLGSTLQNALWEGFAFVNTRPGMLMGGSEGRARPNAFAAPSHLRETVHWLDSSPGMYWSAPVENLYARNRF